MFIDPSTIYFFSPLMGDRNIALLTELTKFFCREVRSAMSYL